PHADDLHTPTTAPLAPTPNLEPAAGPEPQRQLGPAAGFLHSLAGVRRCSRLNDQDEPDAPMHGQHVAEAEQVAADLGVRQPALDYITSIAELAQAPKGQGGRGHGPSSRWVDGASIGTSCSVTT